MKNQIELPDLDPKEENLERFLMNIFILSDEETEALRKERPMTKELFISCIDKCLDKGADRMVVRIMNEYPELSDEYFEDIMQGTDSLGLDDFIYDENGEQEKRLMEAIRKMKNE